MFGIFFPGTPDTYTKQIIELFYIFFNVLVYRNILMLL